MLLLKLTRFLVEKMSVTAKHDWSVFIPKPAVQKKDTKIKKNTITHESFQKCRDYMIEHPELEKNEAWADYFDKCSKGNLPSKFSVVGQNLVCAVTKTKRSIPLVMEIDVLCTKLIEFFQKYDKCSAVSSVTAAPATPANELTWSAARKRVSCRNKLIHIYVIKKFESYDLPLGMAEEKYDEIIKMIDLYGLIVSDVDFENGCIKSMPGAKIQKTGEVKYGKMKSPIRFSHGYCEELDKKVEIYGIIA